jgi:hypothetical protein
MPSEPDQTPIEGLLKSYANKRVEDAGGAAELHPATRRLLQGEVAKLRVEAQAAGTRSWMEWLILFWPRLGAVSAILVMLVTGVWLLLPDSQPSTTTLARNDNEPYRMPSPSDVPLNRELSQNTPGRAKDDKRLDEVELRARQAAPRPDGELRSGEKLRADADRVPRIPAAPNPADDSKQKALLIADAQASAGASLSTPIPTPTASSLAEAKPAGALAVNRAVRQVPAPNPTPQPALPKAAPAVPAPSAVADAIDPSNGKLLSYRRQENSASVGETSQLAALNLRFVQADKEQMTAASKASSAAAAALLDDFQLKRDGKVVRVIDGDGSIYLGEMVDTAASQETVRSPTATPTVPAGGATANSPQFRVAGIHRATGQTVLFEGALLADSGTKEQVETLSKRIEPAPKSLELRSRARVGATSSATAGVPPSDRVVGTVRVNGTNIFSIRAVSVPR